MAVTRQLTARQTGDNAMWEAMGAPAAMKQQIEQTGVDVYPENIQALQVFQAMWTQWHSGMGGREGLRYEALPVIEDRLGVKKKEKADLFWALQVMEDEALKVWAEQREK